MNYILENQKQHSTEREELGVVGKTNVELAMYIWTFIDSNFSPEDEAKIVHKIAQALKYKRTY